MSLTSLTLQAATFQSHSRGQHLHGFFAQDQTLSWVFRESRLVALRGRGWHTFICAGAPLGEVLGCALLDIYMNVLSLLPGHKFQHMEEGSVLVELSLESTLEFSVISIAQDGG